MLPDQSHRNCRARKRGEGREQVEIQTNEMVCSIPEEADGVYRGTIEEATDVFASVNYALTRRKSREKVRIGELFLHPSIALLTPCRM